MEKRTGRLYDLGPDGLGFILDSDGKRKWAFSYYAFKLQLAPNMEAFLELEGRLAEFMIEGVRLLSISLSTENAKTATA